MYSNGDVFEGIFHSGHIEGRGKLTCQHNGVNFEGDFKNSLVSDTCCCSSLFSNNLAVQTIL